MNLTGLERDMLDGGQGEACKFAMTVLVRLGEVYRAERMVAVASAQIMAHYGSLHNAGLDLTEKFVTLGGKFRIPTTEDPASVSFRHWQELGVDPEYHAKQKRLEAAILTLGAQPTWTCTPYNVGNLPRMGQNVSWAESSAVSYANSVIGARTNRTPAGLNYCAALTGRMPEMGLYLTGNRRGQVLVEIKTGPLSDLDYNTLGYLIGKTVGNKIPVLEGLPDTTTADNLKYLGAAAASSGVVALYHVLDVTPEATGCSPFQGQSPEEVIVIDRDRLVRAEQELNTVTGEPDAVALGCPHYSLPKLQQLAALVDGRKVKPGKHLWIYTSQHAYNLAEVMGCAKTIEQAGALILAGNCLVISPMGKHRFRSMMTDSAKFAYYLPSEHQVEISCAGMADCVRAVAV